jgi:hypothetical protein
MNAMRDVVAFSAYYSQFESGVPSANIGLLSSGDEVSCVEENAELCRVFR